MVIIENFCAPTCLAIDIAVATVPWFADESAEIIIEEKNSKANGETLIRKYVRGKLLGKGGFAKCYEITNVESKKT